MEAVGLKNSTFHCAEDESRLSEKISPSSVELPKYRAILDGERIQLQIGKERDRDRDREHGNWEKA